MLLAKGKHGNVPGMRFLCLKGTGLDRNRIMVSVPKKLFKRAVKRKHNLAIEGGLDVLFMYSTKEIMTYGQIYDAVGQIICKINQSSKPKVNEPEQN